MRQASCFATSFEDAAKFGFATSAGGSELRDLWLEIEADFFLPGGTVN